MSAADLDFCALHWAKSPSRDLTSWFLYCCSDNLNALNADGLAKGYLEPLVSSYADGNRYIAYTALSDVMVEFLELQLCERDVRQTRFGKALLNSVDDDKITEFLLKSLHVLERLEADPSLDADEVVEEVRQEHYEGHLWPVRSSCAKSTQSDKEPASK